MKKVVLITSVLSAFFASGCQAESVTSAAAAQSLPVNEINFKDISNHWAEASVQTAVKKKYVDGYADGTFRPEDNVSRAEFIKMVIAANKTEVLGESSGSDWYKPYVKAATDKGILRENDFPIVEINKPISRLEMARISLRSTDKTLQNKALQMDDGSVMYNSTKIGLIQGMANGQLAINEGTTRAQSVTIIERILTLNNGGTLEIDRGAYAQAELALKNTNIFSMIPIFGGNQNSDDHFGITPYTPSKLSMVTPDGKYKGQIEKIIAVDMDNPKDPNMSAVGDITKLKWTATGVRSTLMVSELSNYYIIVVKGHVDFNNDPSLYAKGMSPTISITGIKSPDTDALKQGTLNTLGRVYVNTLDDTNMFVMPKSGFSTNGSIQIKIAAPSIPPQQNYLRNVVDITAPSQVN